MRILISLILLAFSTTFVTAKNFSVQNLLFDNDAPKIERMSDGVTCGWWALHGCFPNPQQAQFALSRHPNKQSAVVINTNNYRNFRNGFFCIGVGAFETQKEAAREINRFGGYIKHDGNCSGRSGGNVKPTPPRQYGQAPGCAGGYWQGSRCVCPQGKVFDAGQCRTHDHGGVNCAGFGQAYFKGTCVKHCPYGFYNNRGFCVPMRQTR